MPANVESMFAAKRPSWHGQEVFRKENVEIDEALEISGTDWEVEKRPVYAEIGGDPENPVFSPEPASDLWAIMRTTDKKILGGVGSRFTPIQNRDTAQFAIDVMGTGGAIFNSGGALDGGRCIWYCLELPEEVKVAGVESETIKVYLNVINYHRPGGFKAIIAPVRIECQNTLQAALRSTVSEITIRHTSGAMNRIAEAKQVLGITYEYTEAFEKECEALLGQKATAKTFDKAYEALWPKPEDEKQVKAMSRWENRLDEIKTVWVDSPNLGEVRKTKWGVYNAFVEWAQWGRDFRGTGGDVAANNARRPVESLQGSTRSISEKAYAALL